MMTKIKKFAAENTTFVAFILLFILAAIIGWPNFLRPQNLINITRQISYTGIIALGMTFVIIAGGIDLSVGSMTAFVGGLGIFIINSFPSESYLAMVLVVVFAIVCGAACGFINGFVIVKWKIAPFIATLGLMSIYRSLIIYFTKAGTIQSVSVHFPEIGSGYFLGLPIPVWCFILLAVVLHNLLNNTKFGRYVCAVGTNEQVALYSAINVAKIKWIPYIITGATVGLTSLMWTSRLNSINPADAGASYELDAIAAVVIGGTSMSGGKGSIIGTVIGAIMLGIINNMLVMAGVSSFLQDAARGLVIIAAVLMQFKNKD